MFGAVEEPLVFEAAVGALIRYSGGEFSVDILPLFWPLYITQPLLIVFLLKWFYHEIAFSH